MDKSGKGSGGGSGVGVRPFFAGDCRLSVLAAAGLLGDLALLHRGILADTPAAALHGSGGRVCLAWPQNLAVARPSEVTGGVFSRGYLKSRNYRFFLRTSFS